MMKFLLGVAAALALAAATPAAACDDCKNCPNHKHETAQAEKKSSLADAEKKKTCGCDHADKACKCGEKCACATCPVHGKKGEKKEEPKKT